MKRTLRNILLPIILLAFMHLDVAIFPYCSGSRTNRSYDIHYYICENGEYEKIKTENVTRGLYRDVNLSDYEYNELDGYQFMGFITSCFQYDNIQVLTEKEFGTNFEYYQDINFQFHVNSETFIYPFYVKIDELDNFMKSSNADIELCYFVYKIDGTFTTYPSITCKLNDPISDILPEIAEIEGYEIEYYYSYYSGKKVDLSEGICFKNKTYYNFISIEIRYIKSNSNEND